MATAPVEPRPDWFGPNLCSDALVTHARVGEHDLEPHRLPAKKVRAEIRTLTAELGSVAAPDHFMESLLILKATREQHERYFELYLWLQYLIDLHDIWVDLARERRLAAELAQLQPGDVDEEVLAEPVELMAPPDLPARTLIAAPSAPPAGRVHHVRPAGGVVAA